MTAKEIKCRRWWSDAIEFVMPQELRGVYVLLFEAMLAMLRFQVEPGKLSWQGAAAAATLTACGLFVGIFKGQILCERERYGWPMVAAILMAGASALFTVAKIADVGVGSWFDFLYQIVSHSFVGFLVGNGIADKRLYFLAVAAGLVAAEMAAFWFRIG